MKPKKEIKYWNGLNYPVAGELFIDSRLPTEEGLLKPFLCYCLGEDYEGDLAFQALWYLGEEGYYSEEFCFDSYVKTINYLSKLQVANETHLAKRFIY